jgi:ABC-type multidrug transport system fused ATPase/permease subunit
MKNGTVAETGTHEELMLKNGDYAKLYDIQASAFLPEASFARKEL